MGKPTIAELEGKIETLTIERDEAMKLAGGRGQDLATVTDQRDAEAAKVRVQASAIEGLRVELEAARGSLRAYKGSATKARNEVLVLQREKSPQARPIGAIAVPKDDGERHRRRVAFEDALRAGPTELVFSDGKKEIRELAPLTIGGDAWRQDARGFTLKPEGHPLLEPGDMTKPSVRILGLALLDEAGEQFAWQQLVEPIDVPRNGRVQLPAGTIRFNF